MIEKQREKSLCISAGKQVWSIRVDVHALNDEGNMMDCSVLATMAALSHFRRQDVTVIGQKVTIHSMGERQPVPLAVLHHPISTTFAFFNGGADFVIDPNIKEELICDGMMSIAVNSHSEICAISKSGGCPVSKDLILRCTKIASERAVQLTSLLKTALKKEADRPRELRKSAIAARNPDDEVNVDLKKAFDSSVVNDRDSKHAKKSADRGSTAAGGATTTRKGEEDQPMAVEVEEVPASTKGQTPSSSKKKKNKK